MKKKEIENAINKIGFTLIDGSIDKWSINIKGYSIVINLQTEEKKNWSINYGPEVKVHRKTTSNFNQEENIVVLDCVTRLLEKGYPANRIELEKKWRVGGYLDILVRDDNEKSFLMIECKTWGQEYNRALSATLERNEKKEQIINYYLQDKNAKYLSFFTSQTEPRRYLTSIIDTSRFKNGSNHSEVHNLWDKTFQAKGIFENDVEPYNINFRSLLKKDLKSISHAYLTPGVSKEGSIFNRFAEILRRHSISDQSNAYNKIFNLFLCKIVDEDNAVSDDYELQFQWKSGEQPEKVIHRLSDLYKRGMKDYMDLELSDISESEFEIELKKISTGSNTDLKQLREIFKQLRLFKNNEFAFKEVIDARTFRENAAIVKEVVKLLETFKIKYEHKQRFLGDFFERLLNIGVKQAAGQFFTPLPITSFISHSIPFEELIKKKVAQKDANFLPYIIDYACGSGHFLNDSMDRVDKVLQAMGESELKTKTQVDNHHSWKRSYKWAREFVYGIEKDYRLAKTTKVACFLNGDGEAKIIYGDGLAPFSSSLYTDKLHSNTGDKSNPVFDVVLANPPFSVESFKTTLENGNESFDLYSYASDKSDDIETFFIERTSQLLNENGYAGLILPSTILLNKGLHQKAREILLREFQIYGICEFGTKAFTYAGQPTIAIFMRKRTQSEKSKVDQLVENFRNFKTDFAYSGTKSIISEYVNFTETYNSVDDFFLAIENENIFNQECIKIKNYLFSYNSNVLVANSLDKTEMKKFLGYEHSSMTKYEGIHPYPDNEQGVIHSMMYDENDVNNPDKLSYLIYMNFLGKQEKIPTHLEKHAQFKKLINMLDFSSPNFDSRIHLKTLDNPFLAMDMYPSTSLSDSDVAEFLNNMRAPIKQSKRGEGKYPYYGASGETGKTRDYLFDEKLVLIGEDGARWSCGEATAYIIEGKSWVNNHAHVLRCNRNRLLEEFLILIFMRLDFSFLKTRPNGGKLQKSELEKIVFPLPPKDVQAKILNIMKNKNGNDRWYTFDRLLSEGPEEF